MSICFQAISLKLCCYTNDKDKSLRVSKYDKREANCILFVMRLKP
jgi:hypothetical protein